MSNDKHDHSDHIHPNKEVNDKSSSDSHSKDRSLSTSQRKAEAEYGPIPGLLGKSEAMRNLWKLIRRAALYDYSLLITGESGTGKEAAARAIHNLSSRSSGPFVDINCSSIPKDLIESELFGHMKGSFTGATMDKKGAFLLAEGGTLFLDEAGEMHPCMQAKLLRVLQERKLRRVGATQAESFDVRVIAATNRNLPAMVKENQYRQDLYQRLAGTRIHIPPLRERKEDIPLLVEHFLAKASVELSSDSYSLADKSLQLLLDYDWAEGNVRELENVIRNSIFNSDEHVLTPEIIREGMMSSPNESAKKRKLVPVPLLKPIKQIEIGEDFKHYEARAALEGLRAAVHYYESRPEAAKRLGMKPTTLTKRMWRLRQLLEPEDRFDS